MYLMNVCFLFFRPVPLYPGLYFYHRVPMDPSLPPAAISQLNTWNAWLTRERRRTKLRWNLPERKSARQFSHTMKTTRRRHSTWSRFTRNPLRTKNLLASGDEQGKANHPNKNLSKADSKQSIFNIGYRKLFLWFPLTTLCLSLVLLLIRLKIFYKIFKSGVAFSSCSFLYYNVSSKLKPLLEKELRSFGSRAKVRFCSALF